MSIIPPLMFRKKKMVIKLSPRNGRGKKILIINNSSALAFHLKFELEHLLPGCEMVFTPTIEAAAIMLKSEDFSVVIAEASVNKKDLTFQLEQCVAPPNLILVGSEEAEILGLAHSVIFELASVRAIKPLPHVEDPVQTVGNDLRNDLNNPLQAILASVYVAKHLDAASEEAALALDAISHAASQMASTVRGLESRIRRAVHRSQI